MILEKSSDKHTIYCSFIAVTKLNTMSNRNLIVKPLQWYLMPLKRARGVLTDRFLAELLIVEVNYYFVLRRTVITQVITGWYEILMDRQHRRFLLCMSNPICINETSLIYFTIRREWRSQPKSCEKKLVLLWKSSFFLLKDNV